LQDVQKAHRKHKNNLQLGRNRRLQPQHFRYGQGNHPEIQHNIQRGRGNNQRILLNAGPLVFPIPSIPVITHGRALKGESKHEGDAVGEGHGTGDFDDPAHSARWEDAQVEKEETDFCQGDAEDVDDLLDVEELFGEKTLVRRESSI
jgi:hypothetical protein